MEDKVLLDVQGLKTYFHTFKGVVKAVDNVSFSLKEGEILGIVGESGSGKSVTSFSILKLVEDPGVVDADHIMFDGKDLAKISEKDMSKIRGKDISMVFQDPMTSLNTLYTIQRQMEEVLILHVCGVWSGWYTVSVSKPALRRYAPACYHCHCTGYQPEAADFR